MGLSHWVRIAIISSSRLTLTFYGTLFSQSLTFTYFIRQSFNENRVLRKGNHSVTEIKEFCEGLLSVPRANFSPFVHATLLDIYEVEAKEKRSAASVEKAKEEAIMLAEKVDNIRSKYWNWRKTQLQKIDVVA